MNLYFNKGLLDNASKIFDIYLRPTHRANENLVTVYTDALNGDNTTTVVPQYLLFASASFITILDKINSAFWNESFDIVTNGERVKLLVNTLLNGTESQRNSALDKLVSMGILSSGEITMTKALASRLTSFDPTLVVRNFDATTTPSTPFYKYSYNIPLGLEKKYDQVRNTQNEKLQLILVGRGHSQFGYTTAAGENFGYFSKYWNELFQKDSFAMGYLAIDLGDIASPDEESIKYDHLDVIEYFDNIVVQIALPNLYN